MDGQGSSEGSICLNLNKTSQKSSGSYARQVLWFVWFFWRNDWVFLIFLKNILFLRKIQGTLVTQALSLTAK